jgi:FSR family fosmidomycin resistance protein-like MFS transporter
VRRLDVISGSGKEQVLQAARPAALRVLFAISFSHLLNDIIQALLPSIYPLLKTSFNLDFVQIGLITLTFQMTASVLQPFVGYFTDRRPLPYSLAGGMGFTLLGLITLSQAHSFNMILLAAGIIGLGSSVFHPEASRVARLASGGRHGFAQSLFQVGGNTGSSLGPLLAAAIVVPRGQSSVLWFAVLALAGIVTLVMVGRWYGDILSERRKRASASTSVRTPPPRARHVVRVILILMALIFSKYFYLACLTNYYTFYLIHRFHASVQEAQVALFVFLFAVAAGTIIGGPVGDRLGRKAVIWVSILGVAPFTLILPHVGLVATIVLSIFIGLILASAFSAILVYAQELIPGRVGLISGLFFGLAFGMAGIASALLGELADRTSIEFVFQVCAYLPLIGLLAGFLPDERRSHQTGPLIEAPIGGNRTL